MMEAVAEMAAMESRQVQTRRDGIHHDRGRRVLAPQYSAWQRLTGGMIRDTVDSSSRSRRCGPDSL